MSESEKAAYFKQLKQDHQLSDEQIVLLKADDETGLATNIQDVSTNIIEQASKQTPEFFENQQIGIYQIMPLQKNEWVDFGSGKLPMVWNKAILRMS